MKKNSTRTLRKHTAAKSRPGDSPAPSKKSSRPTRRPSAIGRNKSITTRKQAEEALQKSELAYRTLVETSHDLIWSVDAQGRWTFVNAAARRIYGYEPSEMLGRPFMDFETPEQAEKDLKAFASIKAGTPFFNYETVHRRKDGTPVWLSFNAVVLRDEQGNVLGTTGTAQDITERKQAEAAMKIFRTLVDHSNDALEVIDPVTGRFLDVSHRGCTDLGYSRDELLTMRVFDIDPMIDPSAWPARVETMRRNGSMTVNSQHRRKDGTMFPVEVNVAFVTLDRDYLVCVVRDITERKKTEDELRWKTAFFEAQVDSALDGILVVDSRGKKVLQNQRMTELWKIPPEFAEDKDDTQQLKFVTSRTKNPKQFAEKVGYLYSHPDEISRDEIEVVDGTVLERYSSPVRDKAGKNYGRIWTFRDITERRKLEEQFRQSQKMESKIGRAHV